MTVVTPEQMRLLERLTDESGVSYLEMMENAGTGLALLIAERLKEKENKNVLFLCGSGNNGGDCFVAARLLEERDIRCTVALLCGEPKTDISKENFQRLKNVTVLTEYSEIIDNISEDKYSIIADGIFGTGFHGELPDDIAKLFEECRRSSAYLIAVDVPSGGNSLTGKVSEGTFKADETVTFGCMKFGMTQYPLKTYCGDIAVRDIDIPPRAFDALEPAIRLIDCGYVKKAVPEKAPDINKGDNGRLLIVAGSARMPGACIMAVEGALKSGAGLVQVASAPSVMQSLSVRDPEAMLCPLECDEEGFITEENYDRIMELSEKAASVLIGCGMGTMDSTKKLVKKLIQNISCPKIIDADGINCIADSIDIIKDKGDEIVLTPHPGEMGRLLGKTAKEVQSDRLAAVTELKDRTGAVCLLKGAGTLIAYKDTVLVNTTGNAGMAKGGSGDVLAGIIASLTAQGMTLLNSASAGVYLHGLSGDIAAERFTQQSMSATDIIKCLSEAFRQSGIE